METYDQGISTALKIIEQVARNHKIVAAAIVCFHSSTPLRLGHDFNLGLR